MNKEGAGYPVTNRRMLSNPVNGQFGSLHSYQFVNGLSSRRGFQETSPQLKDADRLLNARSSRAGSNQQEDRGDQFQAFSGNLQKPLPRAPPFHGYGRLTKSHHDAYGPNSLENLERDQAEVMWKLEQLNYQISRSKELEQRFPINRSIVPSDRYDSRFTQNNGPASSTSLCEMEFPSIPVLPGNFHDLFGTRIMGMASKYTHHPSNGPFCKKHMEYVDPQLFDLYPGDPFPSHLPGSRKILDDSFDLQFHHHVSPVRFREEDPDPAVSGSRYQLQPHERRSINSSSDNSGSHGQAYAELGLASNKSPRHHVAIAGGAPFTICSNCFNLLILPRRMRIKEKNRYKVQCGSCSAVISVWLEEKRLITCMIEDSQDKEDNRGSSVVLNNGCNARSLSLGLSDYGGIKSYDDTEQNFSWTKSEENAFLGEQGLDMGRNEKKGGYSSSFSSSEESKSSVIIERDEHTSPAPQGSTLEKNPRNSTSMIAYKSRWESEKSSDNLNKEKAFLQKGDLPHGSIKDDPEITELEVSASEYTITSLSQDSMDTSKEEDQPKSKKGGGRSFFKGLMKRRVIDQLMPEPIIENERPKVTVNGHPVPVDVVKQAEVHAGPILPGDYWYDYHSGFWGAMKHPCLGIIPPFIEEFNYPLPANCSSGNTGIFVNGRQLHQHDLELLASKGLPTTRNRFYIIDIFGKVINEDTEEELYELGNLAPTVVKAGRGFGMRVPEGMM